LVVSRILDADLYREPRQVGHPFAARVAAHHQLHRRVKYLAPPPSRRIPHNTSLKTA
jgi:hypothetical protein